MRLRKLAAALLLPILLGACSLAPQYQAIKAIAEHGVDVAIKDRQDYNDLKTRVVFALPCDMAYGSIRRLGYQDIADKLCPGGPTGSAIGMDLQQLLILQMLASNPNMVALLKSMPGLQVPGLNPGTPAPLTAEELNGASKSLAPPPAP